MTVPLLDRVCQRLAHDTGEGLSRSDVRRLVQVEAPLLGGPDLEAAVDQVLAAARGLGPLDALLADDAITEVMVNGPGPVWIECGGRLARTDVELSRDEIEGIIERVVGPLGLRADRSAPMVDARLPDGSRVNVVLPPLAVDGPYLTVRRFGTRSIPIGDFADPAVTAILAAAVAERRNVVVSGGTGAGKTTLLNALARTVPGSERIVTVEDAAELRLGQPHVVRLEARPANAEGAGGARVRDLVRNALRMRPDRIIVGECRGGEALDMLQAMNTGHEGSMSTCHANSAADARRRLETMVLLGDVALPVEAVREHVEASIDLLVHVSRRPDGRRRVCEVAEPEGGGVRPVATGDQVVAGLSRPPRRR